MLKVSSKRAGKEGENSVGGADSRGGDSFASKGGDSFASRGADSIAESCASHSGHKKNAGFSKISSQVLANTNRETFYREEGVGRGLIHPRDPRYKAFWYFCMATAVWSAILDPYDAAFNRGGGLTATGLFWMANTLITTAIFYVDIALKFNLGVVDPDTGSIQWSRKLIAWNYFKGKFWLDVLCTFPFTSVIISTMGGLDTVDPVTLVQINILQFLKTGRLYQIFDMFSMFDHNMMLSQLVLVLMRNTTYILFTSHWFACILYLIGHLEMLKDDPSWLSRHYERIDGQPTIVLYIYSLYLSVSAFANVGDNDFFMASPTESIAMICYLVFNIVLGAYILGTITMLVVKGDEHSKAFRDRVTNLKDFSNMNDLSTDLAGTMRTQLELYYTSNHISDENVLDVYPVAIKRKVLRHLYLEAVRKCYVFGGAKAKFLDVLIGASRVEIFMPDIQVLKNGDHVFDLAIIMDGEVEVVAGAGNRYGHKAESGRFSTKSSGNRSCGQSLGGLSMGSQSYTGLHPPNTAIDVRGTSATYGELAFFTEGESAEGVWTTSVVHTLVLSRTAYLALAAKFPYMANKIFDNLKATSSQGMLKTLYDAVFAADEADPGDMDLMDKLLVDADDTPFQIDAMDPKDLASVESYLTPEKQMHLSKLRYINEQIVRYCNNEAHRTSAEMLSAASEGDLTKLRFLHAQGVSVDTADYDMRTPLMVAASTGRKEAIELLLSLGADTQIVDNFGGSVMYEAVNNGYESIIDTLMLHGATLGISRRLELHHMTTCVVAGDCTRLAHFLHAGANPNNRSADMRTVLHLACVLGNIQAVKLLMEDAEANQEVKDVWGYTPLMEAKRVVAGPVIRYLEDKLAEMKRLKLEKEAAEKFAKPGELGGTGAVLTASASRHASYSQLLLPTDSSETDSDSDEDSDDDGDYPVYVGSSFQLTPEMGGPAEGAAAAAELLERGKEESEDIGSIGVASSRSPPTAELPAQQSSFDESPTNSTCFAPRSPRTSPMAIAGGTAGDLPMSSPTGHRLSSSAPPKSILSRPSLVLDTMALDSPFQSGVSDAFGSGMTAAGPSPRMPTPNVM